MNIETLHLDRDVARFKARNLARQLRSSRLKDIDSKYRLELTILRKAYRELSKGTLILDLDQVFQNSPLFNDQFPKLAIARADRPEVKFRWSGSATNIVFHSGNNTYSAQESTCIRRVEIGACHSIRDKEGYSADLTGWTLVPRVPVEHIPESKPLSKLYTLFEVEKWSRKVVASDPYLLRYIGGPFYAVVAQWDLTPLEVRLQQYMNEV